MGSRTFRKLIVVLWKNCVIRKRHWILTLIEVVLPFLLFVLFAYIYYILPNITNIVDTPTIADEQSEEKLALLFSETIPHVYYAPETNFTKRLMKEVQLALSIKFMHSFATEQALLTRADTVRLNGTDYFHLFGVVFEGLSPSSEVPKNLRYKIRTDDYWNTASAFSDFLLAGPIGDSERYIQRGFVALQLQIDKSYIQMTASTTQQDKFQAKFAVQQFPYPPYVDDSGVKTVFSMLIPFMVMSSFIYLCPAILKRIVEEKNTGAKELMRMMGMTSEMQWLGWLLNGLFVNIVTVTLIVLSFKLPFAAANQTVFPTTCAGVLWIFLMLYCIASIFLCFLISTFFSRPTLAMVAGIIVWLMSYFVPLSFVADSRSKLLMFCCALIPNMNMMFGFETANEFEGKGGQQLSWSTLFSHPTEKTYKLSMGQVFIMFLIEIVLFGLLTLYIEAVMPGKYGVARPWNYFLPKFCKRDQKVAHSIDVESTQQGKNFEPQLDGSQTVGIKIRDLVKMFHTFGGSTGKTAVAGLSMDIYSGEITALLGHNGAGKTTTMSIITGLFSPTSGLVEVGGYNIQTHLANVRESLGLCPQHNMLFVNLTVQEHLFFFGLMKGLSRREANREAAILISRMNLQSKADKMPGDLSGGMKRKLCLGIAIIGKSKVLLLDEPTSGLDPEARRELWDLILDMRGERTIVITTHFMEEADVLGDRIAIMDHGQLQCYGTSLYLKKRFGTGYTLSIQKQGGCVASQITKVVQQFIPGAYLKAETSVDVTYSLPSDQTQKFPGLFDSLDEKRAALKIASIGVSITTLEEVFLQVGKLSGDASDDPEVDLLPTDEETKTKFNSDDRLVGLELLLQQTKALFIKKMIVSRRKVFSFIIVVLISWLCIFVASYNSLTKSTTEPMRVLQLTRSDVVAVPFLGSPEVPASLLEQYGKLVSDKPSPNHSNITEVLLKWGTEDLLQYRLKMLVAAEFLWNGGVHANALYSTIALHSAPVSLSLVTNAVLKTLRSEEYSIVTVNHPLPPAQKEYLSGETVFLWMALVPFGLLVVVASFLIFPLVERVSCAKQLQLMAGVSPASYWVVCFLWDYVQYLIVVMLWMIAVYINPGPFNGNNEITTLTFLFVTYGMGGISFAYFLSYFRTTTAGGFSLCMIFNLFIGFLVVIAVYIMEKSMKDNLMCAAFGIKIVMLAIPHFNLGYGLMKFTSLVEVNYRCTIELARIPHLCVLSPDYECCRKCTSGNSCGSLSSYLQITMSEEGGVGAHLIAMAADFFLYVAIIILIDHRVFSFLWDLLLKILERFWKSPFSQEDTDEDVHKEEDRVDGQVLDTQVAEPHDILLARNLMKRYGLRFMAVKRVSFGVSEGECFGLLGVNGAGKTTTFKMLTGDLLPTDGDACIGQYTLRNNRAEYLSRIGYCPQFDAIIDSLTGKEMLSLMAMVRGVPSDLLQKEVLKWLRLMGLTEFSNRQCGTYSGGNKRKLSTAMALVASPPLVFLDEPTSGVDPVSRRKLWNVLAGTRKGGQAIVLTSHSMDECEALCDRLAIMVNGRFMCLGHVSHLKQKFGQGFTIMLKLKQGASMNSVEDVKAAVEQSFKPNCVLKDEHQGLLHYHIANPKTSWKLMFSSMEQLKHNYSIVEDYTISETTLEEVFLFFAKQQHEDKNK